MKIISPEDCGNAPKKRVLKELVIAMANRDIAGFLPVMADDMTWRLVDGRQFAGKDEITGYLLAGAKITELEILHIITHGKTAAVNGRIVTEEGVRHEFCHVFLFVSAGKSIVKEITTYGFKDQGGNPGFL